MAFAMKGGGSRGGLHLDMTVKTCFALSWALYLAYIVVDVTLNMAK